MLFGHTQVALTNSLRGSNPFSEACLIAMDYGRESIIKEDWKKVFDRAELDQRDHPHAADQAGQQRGQRRRRRAPLSS